jgi:hypothetical protein
LRHTFGTRMAAAGAPLRWIQEWMGHSDYRTTSLYADYAPDLSQAVQWAARAVDNTTPDQGPIATTDNPAVEGAPREYGDQRLHGFGFSVKQGSGTKVLLGEHPVPVARR